MSIGYIKCCNIFFTLKSWGKIIDFKILFVLVFSVLDQNPFWTNFRFSWIFDLRPKPVFLNFDFYNVKNSFQNIFQTFWFIDFKIFDRSRIFNLRPKPVLNEFRIFLNFRSVLLIFDYYNVKNSFKNIFQTFWFIDFKILIVLVFSILDQNPFSVWHTSQKMSTIWVTFEFGTMTSGHTVRARIAMAKFFILQAQAIAGFSSCEEAACYPEILRISYNLYKTTFCIGQITWWSG